jgi:hypothetical protein
MKTYWRSRGIVLRIFNLGIRWMWVVSFTPRPLYSPGKEPPVSIGYGGWVDPRTGLDVVARRKIPAPARNRTSVVQPIAWSLYWLSYCGSKNRHKWEQNSVLLFFLGCDTVLRCFHITTLCHNPEARSQRLVFSSQCKHLDSQTLPNLT